MRKLMIALPLWLFLFIPFAMQAQERQRPICGFDHQLQQWRQNPMFAKQLQQQDDEILKMIQSGRIQPETGLHSDPLFTIPVVFHVIHTGGAIGTTYNPPDADILAVLKELNDYFKGIAPNMSGGVGNIQIQFEIAKRDPNCNPTSGIVRVNGSSLAQYPQSGVNFLGTLGTPASQVKAFSRWDPSRYMNIWIVNKIDAQDGYTVGESVTGGFSSFPGVGDPQQDGVVLLAALAFPGYGDILAHEAGHFLDLYHPFQGSENNLQCPPNTNCLTDGDRVCDTDPVTLNRTTAGVFNFSCRTGINSCTISPYSINTERNIMAYTECKNLFTAGQKQRMLAAMQLPSRASLANSLGATPPDQGPVLCPPRINFALGSFTISEGQAGGQVECRKFIDLLLPITISVPPTANATVQLSTSGSALSSDDFILTTNDNFEAPSQTLTFPAGVKDNRIVKIRMFNDGYIESEETLEINFTVNANGGNAEKGTTFPTFRLTITDNDLEPDLTLIKTAQVGTSSANLGNSTGSAPLNAREASRRSAWIVRASELKGAGLNAGDITDIALFLNKLSSRPFTNLQIRMAHTTLNYLVEGGSANVLTGTQTVASFTSYTTVNEWNNFSLQTPFAWDGNRNLYIEMCYDNGNTSTSTLSDVVRGYSDGGTSGQGAMYWQNNINCTGVFSTLSSFGSGFKPTTRFTINQGSGLIASELNETSESYLGPQGELYFFSTNGRIVAKIRNLTNWDYGCVQVRLDRSGTGTKPFINLNTAQAITDKTISVTPQRDNPNGQYRITLYYRKSEVDGYKAATGNLWSQVNIAKTPDPIGQYTPGQVPLSQAVMGTDPIRAVFGIDSSISATFTGGFSGFGAILGTTILPVQWLSFTGKMEAGQARLSWSTASEDNNERFEVEHSMDARDFMVIGKVNSQGSGQGIRNYNFSHIKPVAGMNFYRIRQVDKDGRATTSNVIGLQLDAATHAPRIFPNPARDMLWLDLGRDAGRQVMWELYSAEMKLLKKGMVPAGVNRQGVNVQSLPAGWYVLRLIKSDEVSTLKFIKE